MEAQQIAAEGAETSSATEGTPPYEQGKWRKCQYAIYAIVVVFVIHLAYEILQQASIDNLAASLGTPEWQQAKKELVDRGTKALPYVARAFYYDKDAATRQHAGETLVAICEDLLRSAPKPPAEMTKQWNAWKQEEKLAPGIGLEQLMGRAETSEDAEIRRIAPTMEVWLDWQMWLRHAAGSEIISKGLGDEDPATRQLAAKLVRIFGVEQGVEHERYVHWEHMERLIARMGKDLEGISTKDPKAMRAKVARVAENILKQWEVGSIVGDFGNGALIGMMDMDPDVKVRLAASDILDEVLASAYRADNREEMIRLVYGRRLATLLRMLATPKASTLQVRKILSYSPNMYKKHPELVSNIQLKLVRAKRKSEAAFGAAMARCTEIYTGVEEGRKLGREQLKYLLAD